MAEPFNDIDVVRKTYFIDEGERDSGTPSNDEGKVAQLEDNGRLNDFFSKAPIIREYAIGDSPATWTKPADIKAVFVQLWAGGASGASHASDVVGGGGGGGYIEAWIPASLLSATETITIGAGGASVSGNSSGNDGFDTSFGSLLTALKGIGGQSNLGGNGGDIYGGTLFGGGGGTNSGGAQTGGGGILFGGGGGGGANSGQGTGGSALNGGGGGGGAGTNGGNTNGVGGTSILGGNGGAGKYNGNATDGSEKGGGGGASRTGTSGKGGDGYVRVFEIF